MRSARTVWGDRAPDEEFEVQATAGLGVDLSFDAARRLVLGAAASRGSGG